MADYFYDHSSLSISGQAVVYPGYDPASLKGDLGILRLDKPLPSGTTIYKIVNEPDPWGLEVAIVGYGYQGIGSQGGSICQDPPLCKNTTPFNPRSGSNLAFNLIDYKFETPIYTEPPCLVYKPFSSDCLIRGGGFNVGQQQLRNDIFGLDFDTQNDPTAVFFEGLTDHGDSGGPVFYNPSFQPIPPGMEVKTLADINYIIGITSFDKNNNNNNRTSDYGDIAGYTNLAAYADWILVNSGISASLTTPFNKVEPSQIFIDDINLIQPDPIDPLITSIPEPGTIVLSLVGLIGIAISRRTADIKTE